MNISTWFFNNANNQEIPYMIQSPKDYMSNVGILFTWWWSGDKITDYDRKKDRWSFFSESIVGEWYNIMRFQWWNSKEEFHDMNLADMHQNIKQCVDILSEKCGRIILVWKSAGWAATITYLSTDDRIEWAVVWAPPIEVSGNARDIDETISLPFHNMRTQQEWYKEAVRVLITPEYLKKIQVPVWIVHAYDDNVVPLQNSLDTVQFLSDESKVMILDTWGHSYKDKQSNVWVSIDTHRFIDQDILGTRGWRRF